jgi:hypothetical protein
MPPGATAPGFRAAMVDGGGLAATFPTDGTAVVEPGMLPALLESRRLASPSEDRRRMWQILAEHPRRDEQSPHEARAIEEINRRAELGTAEGMLSALALLLLVTSNADLRTRLEPQLDPLWASIPEMTMWLIIANDALLSRLSMMQLLFQYKYTADLNPKQLIDDHRRSLAAQSLIGRVATSDAVQPIFLLFSPAATGFAAAWLPHTLALEFGGAVDLRKSYPLSLNSIYEPRVLNRPATEQRRDVWVNSIPKGQLGSLLPWWVSRLNLLYGIATDPSRFTTDEGDHDSAAQLAFLLTVERVIADLQMLSAEPQAPALTRLGATFDLIDKLETLLGYGPVAKRKYGDEWRSGAGFVRLLNADEAKPLMRRGFNKMPQQFAAKFTEHGEALFATMYDELRDEVLAARVAPDGVRIGLNGETTVKTEEYAGRVIRAVRNSSHGLLDQLAGREAEIAASHTGALPDSLPELACLIAVALLADPERLWSMDVWE